MATHALGRRWDAKMSAWMFTSAIDAANALSALYAGVHAHRATVAQRELLLEMIADGTGQTAWDIDMHAIDGRWIAGVSRAEARQLINQGIAARRVLGIRPFEDMPAFLSQHKFYKETFAHELATRTARFPQRVAR
jgi:hypothetical protein